MRRRSVGTQVNMVKNDDPDCAAEPVRVESLTTGPLNWLFSAFDVLSVPRSQEFARLCILA